MINFFVTNISGVAILLHKRRTYLIPLAVTDKLDAQEDM